MFVGVTVASSLAAGAPVYLKTLDRMSLDTAVDRAPAHFLRLRIHVPFIPLKNKNLDVTDEDFSKVLGTNLRDISGEVVRHLRTDPLFIGVPEFPLPKSQPPEDAPKGYFQVLSDLDKHIEVVQGRFASDRIDQLDNGVLIEGIVASRLGRFFSIRPGHIVELARSVEQTERIFVRITGFIEPVDPGDPYWPFGSSLFRLTSSADDNAFQLDRTLDTDAEAAQLLEDAEVQTQLGIFVSQESLLGSVGQILSSPFGTVDYYVGVDKHALKQWDPDQIEERVQGFEKELSDVLVGSSSFTGLSDVLEEFKNRSFFSSIPLLLLLAVMLLAVLYYLYMMVNYLVESRADDVASLRTRGTSLGQLSRIYSFEGLVLVAIPAIVAPFLVMGFVMISGRLPYFTEFTSGGLLPVKLTFTPFLVAWATALLCLAIFVIPGVFGGRTGLIAQKLRLARPPALPLFQRHYLDIGLLVIGGLLFWEIQARGHLASGGIFKDVQVNEALLVAPVLVLAVVGLLFMRIFPLLIRFASGESLAFLNIWTTASFTVFVVGTVVNEIRLEYTFDWASVVAVALGFAVAYLVWRSANRPLTKGIALIAEILFLGVLLWIEPLSSENTMFLPMVLLAAVIPLQIAHIGFKLMAKVAPIGFSMTLLRMSRNPLQYTWMMLLLVMLTGLGVLSTTAGATLGVSQEEQILYDLATDIHVTRIEVPQGMGHRDYKDYLKAIPEIENVALGHRTLGEIGATSAREQFPFLALESESFSKVAWFREDFSDRSLPDLMSNLRTGAIPIPLTIPEGASGLGVWVRSEKSFPSIFAMMSVEANNGIIETLNLGSIEEVGWQLLSTGIPREMEHPIEILSFQIFEFVYGPSGNPGAILVDNIYAAMPDADPIVLEDFENQVNWSPFKTSLSASDSVEVAIDSTFPGQRALLYRFSKDTDFGMRGIHRLSESGRIPVLINRQFADSTGVSIGDSFVVTISSRRFPVVVRDVVDYFPTLVPEGVGFMLGEMDTFLRYINMIGPGLRFTPTEIFASTVSEGEAGAINGMRGMDITPDQIESMGQRLANTRVDPLVIAGWKLMVLVSVGLIILLAGTAYGVYLIVFTTRGRNELGTLQTMGLTKTQLIALLGLEHIAIVIIGISLGSWAGFQMSRIMISALSVTETGDPVIPPFVIDTQWIFMAPIYATLGGLILFALLVVYRTVTSMRLSEVSRMEV